MSTEGKKHTGYYIGLLAILGFGLFMTFGFSYGARWQMFSILLTAFFYIAWGMLHHFINHDLTLKIVIEYILIGSLGITVAFFLLKGGLF